MKKRPALRSIRNFSAVPFQKSPYSVVIAEKVKIETSRDVLENQTLPKPFPALVIAMPERSHPEPAVRVDVSERRAYGVDHLADLAPLRSGQSAHGFHEAGIEISL